MVPIRENLVPKDKYAIKCPYTRTPTRVVIHNTANDAPAANEISYMRYNDLEISFHYAVDDVNIVQGIPENRNAWASGDGHGKGNMEGIHIEICYSKSGGEKFDKAEQNAAEFTASLLKKYGWAIDKVTKHRDYDGKYCPHRTLDRGWQRFFEHGETLYGAGKSARREQVYPLSHPQKLPRCAQHPQGSEHELRHFRADQRYAALHNR